MNKISLAAFAVPESPTHAVTINDATFNVKEHVPYELLLTHIQWSLLLITDSNGYISEPVKRAVEELILVAAFTDLDFSRLELATIEQTEIYEMYDIIRKTGIYDAVLEHINPPQYHFYIDTLNATLASILNYRNSVAGMLELISTKSGEMKDQLSNILADFADPAKTENVIRVANLLKEVTPPAE